MKPNKNNSEITTPSSSASSLSSLHDNIQNGKQEMSPRSLRKMEETRRSNSSNKSEYRLDGKKDMMENIEEAFFSGTDTKRLNDILNSSKSGIGKKEKESTETQPKIDGDFLIHPVSPNDTIEGLAIKYNVSVRRNN